MIVITIVQGLNLPLKNATFGPFGHLDLKGVPDVAEEDLADVVATGKPQKGTIKVLLDTDTGSAVLT